MNDQPEALLFAGTGQKITPSVSAGGVIFWI